MNIKDSLDEVELLRIAESYLTDKDNFNNSSTKSVLLNLKKAEQERLRFRTGEFGLLGAMDRERMWASTIEQVGANMPLFIDGPVQYFSVPDYWASFKREFQLLVCTNDAKYASVRKQVERSGTKSQMVIVSMFAAAMTAHIGIAAGALVPFCAIGLLAIAKVGKNAFCGIEELDIPIKTKKKRGSEKRSKTAGKKSKKQTI